MYDVNSINDNELEPVRPFDIMNLINNDKNLTEEKPLIQIAKLTGTFWDFHLPETTNIKQEYDITINDLLNDDKEGYTSTNIILNVPSLSFKDEKLSKMDIATKKRKLYRLKKQAKGNSIIKKSEDKQMRVVYERIKTHSGTVTNFGVHVHGYSDTSSSSSYASSNYDSEVDVEDQIYSIDSIVCDKLQFLNMLELTTLKKWNALETRKLERRKWIPNLKFSRNEINKTIALDLPVPCKSSPTLNNTPDYYLKRNFFFMLGLQSIPLGVSYEYEKIWFKVITERLKRNCESAVTLYSQKFYEDNFLKLFKSNRKFSKENENLQNKNPLKTLEPWVESFVKICNTRKLLERNNVLEPISSLKIKSNTNYCCINVPVAPHKIQKAEALTPRKRKLTLLESDKNKFNYDKKCKTELELNNKWNIKIEEKPIIGSSKSISTQTFSNFVLPVTMILVDNRTMKDSMLAKDEVEKMDKSIQCLIKEEIKNGKTEKWPGVQNVANTILESYILHCKDSEAEANTTKETIKRYQEIIKTKQTQRVFLECKLRTLQSTLYRLKQSGLQIQKTVDYLSRIVNAFR